MSARDSIRSDILRGIGLRTRSKPRHPEHDMQVVLFKWAKMSTCMHPELALMFAIPNGGARDSRTGAMLKAEGVKSGVPDIFLACPHGSKAGLFIELKAGDAGRISEAQASWIASLNGKGYEAVVCRTLDKAVQTITSYLNGDETQG